MLVYLIVGFICFFYWLLISIFVGGWTKIPSFHTSIAKESDSNIFLSVIVACKNEEKLLPELIKNILNQNYTHFELILVDDNSIDNTRIIMKDASQNYSNVKFIESTGYGKKNAIKEGIQVSRGDFIVTTDCDCTMSSEWLQTIVSYQNEFNCDLIICPVKLSTENTLFSHLQSLEFITLVASGAAASGARMPILCNAANLAFKKKSWEESQTELREELQSGDDIFLLQSIKKRKGVIRFLKSEKAFVVAQHLKSIGEFITQRQRWASKSIAYTDWQLIFTSYVIFSISFLILALFGISIFSIHFLPLLCFVVIFKYIIDIFFIYKVQRFFEIENPVYYSLILSVLHPFYIVFISFSSLFVGNKKWK